MRTFCVQKKQCNYDIKIKSCHFFNDVILLVKNEHR